MAKINIIQTVLKTIKRAKECGIDEPAFELLSDIQLLEKLYPKRVHIDNEFFKDELQELEFKNFIKKDNDEQYYVNYFYDENALKLIKGKCEKLIDKHGKYDLRIKDPKRIYQQEKTINKHVWLLVKFNECCEEIGCENLKMNYILKINSRLFKMEVSCYKNENAK